MLTVSIVVPVYSGALYVRALVDELSALREKLLVQGAPFGISEIIFVDDSAVDDSSEIVDGLAAEYTWVRALHLSRNFGQHPATIAGILHTSGDWVVTMDEDLQHPPARIPDLFSVVADISADVVYGSPNGQVHQSLVRDFTSRNYKRFIERLTGNKNIRKVSSFRLARGPLARAAASVCGHDTYFDIALTWFTQRIEAKPMQLKDARYINTKKSGYSFKALMSHARRLAISSQIKLLRIGAAIGLAMLVLSFILAVFLIFAKIFASSSILASGWTSLMLAICFFNGTILLLVGVVLEFLSILVMRAHGRPTFFTVDRSGDLPLRDYFREHR